MLPRPSTTISFQPWSLRSLRSAWRTIDPSGSRRESSSPVTRSRPSGSQSMDQPSPGRPWSTTPRSRRPTCVASPPNRELPIIRKIATGSLRNKILFILPAALILSAIAPVLVEVILMVGGTYLCFEGAEKIYHRFSHHHADTDDVPAVMQGPEVEAKTISGAIRTDFILSAEIMVIALKEVLDEVDRPAGHHPRRRRPRDHRRSCTASSR